MPLSVIIGPGYNFSDGEKVTYTKLNMLGSPAVTFTGSIDSNQITDGAVLTSKLEQGIDINSKISDHNLNLTKLEAGTQGQLLYYNSDGDLVKLSPGSDGQFLKTKGSGANPEWAAQDGTDTINISQINTDGADKFISTDSAGAIQWEAKSSLSIAAAQIWEQQLNSVHAGTSVANTDTTRVLNTLSDPNNIVTSLSSNQFILESGTYAIQAKVPGNDTGNIVGWLYNVTDTQTQINGSSVYFGSSDTETYWSNVAGVFQISGQKTFELRFRADEGELDFGLGRAASLGRAEVYSHIQIIKLS